MHVARDVVDPGRRLWKELLDHRASRARIQVEQLGLVRLTRELGVAGRELIRRLDEPPLALGLEHDLRHRLDHHREVRLAAALLEILCRPGKPRARHVETGVDGFLVQQPLVHETVHDVDRRRREVEVARQLLAMERIQPRGVVARRQQHVPAVLSAERDEPVEETLRVLDSGAPDADGGVPGPGTDGEPAGIGGGDGNPGPAQRAHRRERARIVGHGEQRRRQRALGGSSRDHTAIGTRGGVAGERILRRLIGQNSQEHIPARGRDFVPGSALPRERSTPARLK